MLKEKTKKTIAEAVSEVSTFSSSMFVSTIGGLILKNAGFSALPIYLKVPLQIGNVCVGAYVGFKVGNYMDRETYLLLNEFAKLEESIQDAQSVKVEG